MKKALLIAAAVLLIACGARNEQYVETEKIIVSQTTAETLPTETEKEVEEAELEKFTMSIEAPINEEDYVKIWWMNDSLTESLVKAAHLKIFYSDYFYSRWFENKGEIEEDGKEWVRTGVEYESFENMLKAFFTDDFTEKILNGETVQYKNFDGELCYSVVGGEPSSPNEKELTFTIEEYSEDRMTLKCQARFFHPDEPDKVGYTDYYYNVVYKDGGWVFDNFPLWLSSSGEYEGEKADFSVTDDMKEAAADILAEFGDFCYSYIYCKDVMKNEWYTKANSVNADGKMWYKVTDGDHTSFVDFSARLMELCTVEMANSLSVESCYRMGNNGELYIWADSGLDGGVMGIDTVYLSSAVQDGDVCTVTLIAEGSAEEWGYENDLVQPYNVVLKKKDGVWKLHECGVEEEALLAWLFRGEIK